MTIMQIEIPIRIHDPFHDPFHYAAPAPDLRGSLLSRPDPPPEIDSHFGSGVWTL